MARIDYHAIEAGIQTLLRGHALLREFNPDLKVEVEKELMFGKQPQIIIYLMSRAAPADEQTISAGTETRFNIRLSIWCWANSFKSLEDAQEKRDDLLSRTELALMSDRQLNGTVDVFWIEGGEFRTPGSAGGSFNSGAEIEILARATATN